MHGDRASKGGQIGKVPLIATVYRAAYASTIWTASTTQETTGSDVKVGGAVGRDLLDAAVRNRPKFLHSPLKIGVSIAQSKRWCNPGTIHAKCGRTLSTEPL
jgi:hypothetical protein